MTAHHGATTPPLSGTLPPETVLLAPTVPAAVPMRPPAGAWGLVVIALRTTDAAGAPVRHTRDASVPDPAHTDTADLFAGVWLPEPPPATLHAGDVVVLLHTSTADPARTDVEVLAAMQGEWRTVGTWDAVNARWPHEVAMTVLVHMRYLADAAFHDAQWPMLTGPLAAAMPDWLSRGLGLAGEPAASAPRRAPDGLAELLEAGLLAEGDHIVLGEHVATVRAGGILQHGPDEFAVSAVNALATHLCDFTANGWHLWQRAHDNRPLADLRTELARR
ncbi:hypothetical protein BBK82_07710 [Lentzea guizhouensis]|uniref:RAMA domain-containing protein n=1 Tax=Lentzea guizhouensis TaxID=1586287 RepID=A0A1B2HE51_9PSEU|nr:hypothetical protein [Lentzea guizhouensis]ANZ35978.1 hypothetical protein BBK82_07710 [Lentzea guizhouensis]